MSRITSPGPMAWVLVALYFIILQFVIVTGLALLFSSFSSPLMSAVFAFSLFIVGAFAEDLRGFAGMTKGVTRWIATGAAYLVPNFSALNVITPVAHGQPVSGQLDHLQHRVRADLCHHDDLRGGIDLRTPEPEMNRSRITLIAASCWFCVSPGSVLTLHRVDELRTHATLQEVLYVSSPQALKRVSLGYDGLLADVYWTRAVQYFGSQHVLGDRRL